MTDATVATSRDRFHAVAADAPTGARVAVEERILVDGRDLLNAVRRGEQPHLGVQFSPESILTEGGREILRKPRGIRREVNQ